jgi:hypothetical protein
MERLLREGHVARVRRRVVAAAQNYNEVKMAVSDARIASSGNESHAGTQAESASVGGGRGGEEQGRLGKSGSTPGSERGGRG